jgi:hypothetical protein
VQVVLHSLLNLIDLGAGQDQPLGHQVRHLSNSCKI